MLNLTAGMNLATSSSFGTSDFSYESKGTGGATEFTYLGRFQRNNANLTMCCILYIKPAEFTMNEKILSFCHCTTKNDVFGFLHNFMFQGMRKRLSWVRSSKSHRNYSKTTIRRVNC